MGRGGASCAACGAEFPMVDGYLDLLGAGEAVVTPIQRIMQWGPAVAVYDALWRPLGYFVGSRRSFARDADTIAASVPGSARTVLDLACGPGTLTRRLAKAAPGAKIVGFDLSGPMLARAARVTAADGFRNVLYVRGDVLAMPFPDEAFDAVTCCGALQLFPDQDRAMGEIARVLRPEGDFVCQTTLGPARAPWWVRAADRVLKFGYFQRDTLTRRLARFHFALRFEQQTRINYIFRASKLG
jgi:ubiquinone/menaquinone biosynthesis C-methylase UbiE